MTINEDSVVLENNDDHYLVEEDDGTPVKLWKIDQEKMDKQHQERVDKVAVAFNEEDIKKIVSMLEKLLEDEPSVSRYYTVALDLSILLKTCYDKVGKPNLFWYPIKNIDPAIYGRAQMFMGEVMRLYIDMLEIRERMQEIGKIEKSA